MKIRLYLAIGALFLVVLALGGGTLKGLKRLIPRTPRPRFA